MDEPNQKTVFVLDTSFALLDVLNPLFKRHIPWVRVVNIVDDSLLADVRSAGRLIPSVTRRLIAYALAAQSAGASAIFNACSSVGEAASLLREALDIPVVKIDDRMAEEAVARGSRIAVIATVETTLDPTARLIKRVAATRGNEVFITRHLVAGAFEALSEGNSKRHDEMVSEEIERAAQSADVVALAQASMSRLVPAFDGKLPVHLLSSPTLSVLQLKQILEMQGIPAFEQRSEAGGFRNLAATNSTTSRIGEEFTWRKQL